VEETTMMTVRMYILQVKAYRSC